MKLSGNRIRKSSGEILHFDSARKRANWERMAQAYKHGWRPTAKHGLLGYAGRKLRESH